MNIKTKLKNILSRNKDEEDEGPAYYPHGAFIVCTKSGAEIVATERLFVKDMSDKNEDKMILKSLNNSYGYSILTICENNIDYIIEEYSDEIWNKHCVQKFDSGTHANSSESLYR